MVGSNGTLGRGGKQPAFAQSTHRRNSYVSRKISDESELDSPKGLEPSLKFSVNTNSRTTVSKNENGSLVDDVYNTGGHIARYAEMT